MKDNGALPPGTYFLKGYSGVGKETQRPFGFVDVFMVMISAPNEGEYVKLWCDPPVALAAASAFNVGDAVRIETSETVYGGKLQSRLSGVYPA